MDNYNLLRKTIIYYRDTLPKPELDSPLEQILFYSVQKDMLERVLHLMEHIDIYGRQGNIYGYQNKLKLEEIKKYIYNQKI